jgi:hypothetical protein
VYSRRNRGTVKGFNGRSAPTVTNLTHAKEDGTVKKEDGVKLLMTKIEAALRKFLYEAGPNLLKSHISRIVP